MRTIAVATIALGLASCGHHAKLAQYREPMDGWTVSYPASMTPRAIGYAKGVLWARGAVIASSPEVHPTQEVYFKRFPRDAVAFGLVRFFGGPGPTTRADTKLPLQRAGFRPVEGAPPPVPLEQSVSANGSTWRVTVWFGPKASYQDKEKVWRIVESIDFPKQ